MAVLALLLVALSIGLDNFGAAAALGVSGVDVDQSLRLRITVIFGAFEAAMPVLGLLLGHAVADQLGSGSKVLAGAVLCLAGAYVIVEGLRANDELNGRRTLTIGRLLLLGGALSIDNLAVGFALGSYQVNVLVAALVIALVSVSLTLLGLEIGARFSRRVGRRSELLGGATLMLVGLAVGTGLI